MIDLQDIGSIVKLHDALVEEFGGLGGIHDLSLLKAAILRPFTGFANGSEAFSDLTKKAAALLEGMIQYHPFVDGNKRTGMTLTKTFLRERGVNLEYGDKEVVEFTLAIARRTLSFDEIERWIARRSTPLARTET
jgi:death-on-curing protein